MTRSFLYTLRLTLLAFVFCPSFLFGQLISKVDFDEVKRAVEDENSEYYYPKMQERVLRLDTTFRGTDYFYLYYGFVFQEKYNPYGMATNEETFMELVKNGAYQEAIPYGITVLAEKPASTSINYYMLLCHHKLEHADTAQWYADIYFSLLDVIYTSGDGKSMESAYVVTEVADEYQIMADLDVMSTSQALSGVTDIITLDQKSQKPAKGKKKIKKLYFNVEKPFENLSKMFK